jgi:hypothetical protein
VLRGHAVQVVQKGRLVPQAFVVVRVLRVLDLATPALLVQQDLAARRDHLALPGLQALLVFRVVLVRLVLPALKVKRALQEHKALQALTALLA